MLVGRALALVGGDLIEGLGISRREFRCGFLLFRGRTEVRPTSPACGRRVSELPTPEFFYGMQPGDEVSIDVERGKTLIVDCDRSRSAGGNSRPR
jgi:hypothetical protein